MADPSLFARVAGNALYYGAGYYLNRYMSRQPRKRGIGGATFQGKFGGIPKKPRYAKLDNGFAEKVTFAGVASGPSCCYLGFTSIPTIVTGSNDSSRLLVDICIAILRDFYKRYHPGRIEFESPDQSLGQYALQLEVLNLVSRFPDPTTGVQSEVTLTISASTSLRDLGYVLATAIMAQWQLGREPFRLYSYGQGDNVPRSSMFLNNLIVKAKVTNVYTIQNQSLADDGAGGDLDANTTVDVSANPLKGRMFYMKHICPEISTGYRADQTAAVFDDEWGATYLKRSTIGTLRNVISPDQSLAPATGCWKVIPKAEYFKNCSGIKDVGLEPGVQKTFKLWFRFNGPLTNFLRCEFSNYAAPEGTGPGISFMPSYKMGMGQSVLLAFEKRLRQTGSNITVAYQVESYLRTNIGRKRQNMTYHVETNV